MKGQESYSSGTKETWRCWQWNRVVDLLCDGKRLGPSGQRERLKDKVVLYLVGPEDVDRECAIKRGFRSENCIAVDIDKERVRAVRRNGGISIQGSLHQVLLGFKDKVDVVIADFCHGLTNDAMALRHILYGSPLHHYSVVSVNMMRGRDSDGDEWMRIFRRERFYEEIHVNPKSRAGAFYFDLVCACESLCDSPEERREMIDSMQPSFGAYKSPESNQYFDSVVFRWPFGARSKAQETMDLAKKLLPQGEVLDGLLAKGEELLKEIDGIQPEVDEWVSQAVACLSKSNQIRRRENMKGKIAALRAVRTMHKKGVRR